MTQLIFNKDWDIVRTYTVLNFQVENLCKFWATDLDRHTDECVCCVTMLSLPLFKAQVPP